MTKLTSLDIPISNPLSDLSAEATWLMTAADRINGRHDFGSVPVFARRHAR